MKSDDIESDDLKVGVIGSGGRGAIAAQAHQPGAGSRIVACCEAVPETLARNRESYGEGIFVTSDYRELLAQPLDAIFLCTPDFLHETMAIAALQSGKAVYLEKPMAITTAGCDRILLAAREAGARLFVGHNMRYMAFILKMKALIDAGAIGEVKTIWCRHFVGNGGDYYFKDWHAERKNTTSMLLQKGAHDIDVIHWLAGGYSQLVHALGDLSVYNRALQNPDLSAPEKTELGVAWPPLSQRGLNEKMDIEDLYLMQMRLDNGVLACYQECHYAPDYWRNYTVIGTHGRLENFGDGGEGTSIHLWSKRKPEWCPPDEIIPVPIGEGGHGGSDPSIVQEFVRFAREGGPTKTSPVAARYSVAAGCAATESLRNGGAPIEVPRVDDATTEYFQRQA